MCSSDLTRRIIAKLVLFYKIRHNIAPRYLRDLIPDAGQQTDYNLRNQHDVRLPRLLKNYFLKSYIPSSIKLWNGMAVDMREIAEVETFKLELAWIYSKLECYKPYLQGITLGHINLSRIRMGLSGLNAQRK